MAEPDELHQKVLYLFSGESYLILQLSATSGNKAMNLFGVLLFFVWNSSKNITSLK